MQASVGAAGCRWLSWEEELWAIDGRCRGEHGGKMEEGDQTSEGDASEGEGSVEEGVTYKLVLMYLLSVYV